MFRGFLISLALYSLSVAGTSHAQSLPDHTLTKAQIEIINLGMPISEVRKAPEGQIDVFGVIDIGASPESIWANMKDCSRQLKIIPDLKACDILEEGADGLWDRREQIMRLGFPLPSVRSEFRSDYTPLQNIRITRTGGDLSVLNGEWILTPLSSGITRVSYRARMKSRLPIPRRFIRKGVERHMPLILSNLKSAVEAQD